MKHLNFRLVCSGLIILPVSVFLCWYVFGETYKDHMDMISVDAVEKDLSSRERRLKTLKAEDRLRTDGLIVAGHHNSNGVRVYIQITDQKYVFLQLSPDCEYGISNGGHSTVHLVYRPSDTALNDCINYAYSKYALAAKRDLTTLNGKTFLLWTRE